MEQTQAKSTLALHKEGNKSRSSDLNMAIHKATVLKVEMKGFIRTERSHPGNFFLLAIILNVFIITTYDKKQQPK